MGYFTWVYGTIKLKSEKARDIIEYLIENEIEPFDWNISINNMEVEFADEWKTYENEIENLCYLILKLDEDAKGEIGCDGDERDDNWKVIVNKGIKIYRGEIQYKFANNYSNEETEKKAKELLNDGELTKKIVINKLK